MNENRGAKGGQNDRKRVFRIRKKQLEKLKTEQETEKEIRKSDRKTFLKIIPIVLLGESFRVFFSPKIKRKKKKEIELLKPAPSIENIQNRIPFQKEKKEEKKKKQTKEKKQQKTQMKFTKIPNQVESPKKEPQKENSKLNTLLLPTSFYHHLKKESQKEELTSEQKETKKQNHQEEEKPSIKWEKITNKKLIEEYEKRLKEIRYELRNLTYEYPNIEKEKEKARCSKQTEELIDRLNLVIKKLEQLQARIKIEDINQYEDPYLYQLIQEYMQEFDNKNWVSQIKNSDLYLLLSEKLQEIEQEKEKLKRELLEKKERQDSKEQKLQEIKNKYDHFEDIDRHLREFQEHQKKIISNMENDIKNSIKTYEKVQTQMIELDNESKKLLELIALQMMIPKLKGVKTMIGATIIYMHFMRKFLSPDIKTKKYQLIQVEDYSKTIENSLYEIDKTSLDLKNISQRLREMLIDFKREYQEYIDTIPECRNLLQNLEKVQDHLSEKEYELTKLKQKQEKNLQVNNEKVKKWNNKINPLPE